MRILKIAILIVAAVISGRAAAQTTAELLDRVAANNLTLKALENRAMALGEESLAAVALPDPEIEFALLAGSPSEIGVRKDISLTQSFDFAAISGARKNVAIGEVELLKLEWKSGRREVLLQARRLIAEIVCRNALIAEYDRRLGFATSMEAGMHQALDNGAATALDYNKSLIALAEIRSELTNLALERESLLLELAALNGGERMEVPNMSMDPEELPEDFETWFTEASESSSAIAYVRRASELSRDRMKMARSEALPELSLGYMAELVPGSDFRGVKMGVSIPLWSASRKIRGAKLGVEAADAEEKDAVLSFRTRAEALYATALGLKKISDELAQTLLKCDNSALIQRAYELGELSQLQYLVEMDLFYEAVTRSIEAERDYQIALADLMSLAL